MTHFKCNHYVTDKHFFILAKDKFFTNYQGQLAFVNVNYGKGAYQTKPFDLEVIGKL